MDTSYLSTQVTTIISKLHGLFDEIGVPSHERENRETELFTALSETLNNQLRLVTAEKNELIEEAHHIIKSIRQMDAALEGRKSNDGYIAEDASLKITSPLTHCIKLLKEKHAALSKKHRERLAQVQKLAAALESYASHLEPSFLKITLPPSSGNASPSFDLSSSYEASLNDEFSRVYEEYQKRISSVQSIAEDVVNLWAELGTPQAQTSADIIKNYRESPEQLGLHETDISRLVTRKEKLLEEKQNRELKLKELKANVEALWDRLGVEEMDRKRFLAGTRGCGLRVINELEAELDRLNELKRQNLHLFVEDARFKLQELWDSLYFSEEEMLEFAPAFSDVYSDALLSAHENEIQRLEALKEQRLPTLQLIDRHQSLLKDREELAASSQDASRLMLKGQKGEKRDPGKLLREEKMRKRIAKDLPKIEIELRKILEKWEDEFGRPFMVHGERYLDEIEASAVIAPPPRSKTPSVAPIPTKGTKTAPSSRQGSVLRVPPSRTGSKTPGPSGPPTLRRNPLTSSVASTASKTLSPSKIPARPPLSTMKTGNNSPERRPAVIPAASYDTSTIRKHAPPARAPPPKMRDLFAPPAPTLSADSENWRCASVASSGSGSIRQVELDDPYDDREHMSYAPPGYPNGAHANRMHRDFPPTNGRDLRQHHSHHMSMQHEARIPSNASSASQAVSGSENWETYDDASDPEEDSTPGAAYNAKLQAVGGKRTMPEGGYPSPRPGHLKKAKNVYASYGQVQTYVEDNGRMIPTGSDAGWTDEDAF